jgi:hypothetical protein
MMAIASGNPDLAKATSFMQIEYGLDELRASWDGFVDTSKHYSVEFKTRKHLCNEFAKSLAEYIIQHRRVVDDFVVVQLVDRLSN